MDRSRSPRLNGRTFVVTGANSGIGLAAARALARAGARVVLAVRDVAKGEARRRDASTGDAEVRRLDLADLASVRAFADAWDGDLDVLINNAGVMAVPQRPHRGRLRDAVRHQPPRPLRADQPAAAARHATASSPCPPARTGSARSTSTTSTGSAAATRAGAPTGSRSSPTCSSSLELQRRLTPRARASARSPRTPATPPPTSSTARNGREHADGPRKPRARPEPGDGRPAHAVRRDAGPAGRHATSGPTAWPSSAGTRRSSGAAAPRATPRPRRGCGSARRS